MQIYGLNDHTHFNFGVQGISFQEIIVKMNIRKCRQQTAPFRSPSGDILTGSVAENGYVHLGGIDQYVMIRGESVTNPLLIILHGGPGFSDTAFLRHFNSILEKSFTIVYWDQRGTGKSFSSHIENSTMVVERFIADLNELIDLVCARFKKRKVVLFGHSWGSVLGVLFAKRFPLKVAAYIGCAQYGNWLDSETASYNFALAEALRKRKFRIYKALQGIGPPPYPARSLLKERTLVQRLEGQLKPHALLKMMRIMLGNENGVLDLVKIFRGFQFSINAMWDEVLNVNLLASVPTLQVPVYFLLGRRDHWVPPETSVKYYNSLIAPSKEILWFHRSGHEPFVDEAEKFNKAMTEWIQPVVKRLDQIN